MSLYFILPIAALCLIAFGAAVKKFAVLRESVLSGSGLILLAMASLAGYVLQILPFALDYAEVNNLSQKAEENIMWARHECETLLLTLTLAGSLVIFLAGFAFEKFYRDGKLDGKEISAILALITIGLCPHGLIIYYNHVIHIEAYTYIDSEAVEQLSGRTRFIGGISTVALNIVISMLSVAWPYLFEKFRDKKFDPKKESKPTAKEEKKDDKPIGAPDTVRTGDYKPEPMNLNVPVLTKPDENFPLPFNLRA